MRSLHRLIPITPLLCYACSIIYCHHIVNCITYLYGLKNIGRKSLLRIDTPNCIQVRFIISQIFQVCTFGPVKKYICITAIDYLVNRIEYAMLILPQK